MTTLKDLRQLIELYAALPDDTLIVLQKDAEGNGYSPLSGISEAMYVAETRWSGEAYDTPEQIRCSDDLTEEDEAPEGAVLALVLFPVN